MYHLEGRIGVVKLEVHGRKNTNDLQQLHMTSRAIACRLRTLRQKSGLSQIELARILGFNSEIPVSRHELSLRLPSLLTALGYSILFRVPLDEIFPGIHGTVEAVIEERLAELEAALSESTVKGPAAAQTARKLEFICGRKESGPISNAR